MSVCQKTFFDYEGFVEKFKPKKTTDDCYTPTAVYDCVLQWAREHCNISPDAPIVRPFFPGGDYERFEYPEGCVVVDNPPFSICKKIIDFYKERDIPFFLFVPGLTCFWPSLRDVCIILVRKAITYDNGANVQTGFATNMLPHRVLLSGSLGNAITAAQKKPDNHRRTIVLPDKTYNPGQIRKFIPKAAEDIIIGKDEGTDFFALKDCFGGAITVDPEIEDKLRKSLERNCA